MKFFNFSGFAEILQESFKIFFKNGKLMTFVTIIPTLFLYSSIYLSNIGSIQFSFIDLLFKQSSLFVTNLSTIELFTLLYNITQEFTIRTGFRAFFFIAFLISHFFSLSITIVGSCLTYREKNVSNGEMVSMVLRSWKRLFVTGSYISVFHEGYIRLVMTILFTFVLMMYRPLILFIFWNVLSLSAVMFSIYLSVVWTLSLVVCVVDESCYGFEAFGKAAKLIKGHKMQGFAITLISTIVVAVCMLCTRLITFGKSSSIVQVVIGLLVVSLISLVKILTIIGYTVLFNKCKKTHGEEVELQESTEYSKIQEFAPLVSDNIA